MPMTKSAKHGTPRVAAGPAGPEPAASTRDTEPARDTGPAQETEPAAGPATGDAATPDLDEVKRKFREALDRKRDLHKAGQGKGGQGGGKVNGAHGPAASRRSFRRKSG